jgi:DNA-binding LytR/AlgR family response regulator
VQRPERGLHRLLSPHGFARTHRSWLVNRDRILEIEPAGSGDFKLRLADEVSAPPSRRYRDAIDVPPT